MEPSKKAYSLTEKFNRAMAAVEGDLVLPGDVMIVERIKRDKEKKVGKIVVPPSHGRQSTAHDSNEPEFVRVLAIGSGYEDEAGKAVAPEVVPGYVVEVGRHSVNWFSSFGDIIEPVIGITRQGEARSFRFRDEASYTTSSWRRSRDEHL